MQKILNLPVHCLKTLSKSEDYSLIITHNWHVVHDYYGGSPIDQVRLQCDKCGCDLIIREDYFWFANRIRWGKCSCNEEMMRKALI